MDYVVPAYSRQDVNGAGKYLRYFYAGDATAANGLDAFDIVDNWRASHAYPLNSFTMTLRNRALRISAQALVSQRVKRLPSIAQKLVDREDMKLTQMQDIAGCRAVLPTLAQAYELCDQYLMDRRLIHQISGKGVKDYIEEPKRSGYRSIHLKYRFTGRVRTLPYNDLKVEIQIRSLLQHRWATAVEAAGTFTHAALKSSKGAPHWLRFFALMSSVFALREGCPVTPDTFDTFHELRDEIRALEAEHRLEATFSQIHSLLPRMVDSGDANYFYYLVTLDPAKNTVDVEGFKKNQSRAAHEAYTAAEEALVQDSPTQVVLVSVPSINALSRAYPNYFLDTRDFLDELREILWAPGA